MKTCKVLNIQPIAKGSSQKPKLAALLALNWSDTLDYIRQQPDGDDEFCRRFSDYCQSIESSWITRWPTGVFRYRFITDSTYQLWSDAAAQRGGEVVPSLRQKYEDEQRFKKLFNINTSSVLFSL